MADAMIVAPQPDAVEAGAVVLREGGNAVDAATACAFVQMVVDPLMCGVAGFGTMQLFLPAAGVHECIDFHGKVPAAATPDMWADRILGETDDGFGFVLEGAVNDLGYQSITTPGTLKAFHEAHARHGRLPWERVLAPAIAFARDGFDLHPGVYLYWMTPVLPGRTSILDRLRYSPSGRRIYCGPDGAAPKPIGSRIRNPDFADTLERIAREGAADFYTGELARRIDADLGAGGALLTGEDLARYETTRNAPLWGEYRGHPFATNRPPGGGVMLVEMLNILESFDLAAMGHNSPEYIRTVSEAMKAATADKDRYVGDPAFVDVPLERLCSREYARGRADAIRRGERFRVERLGIRESSGTTHVSVVDHDGAAVSVTHSLGMMSGVVTEGLGFMYNGCMAVFDPRPGRAGSIAPGKSRFSSACPTVVFHPRAGKEEDAAAADLSPRLVLGAPGGTHIAMGVMQTILNVVDFGMSVGEAVLAPRFSATHDAITVTARIPRYACAPLEREGYAVERLAASYDIASVHAIEAGADGRLRGGADIVYGGGMALGVPGAG